MARKRVAPTEFPGMLSFPINGEIEVSKLAKRSQFETKRRKEVANVRAIGACLHCRQKKLPCSNSRPCRGCVKWARYPPSLSRLSISCVPSSVAGLKDFFKLDGNALAAALSASAPTLDGIGHLASQPIELDFEAQVKWNIEDLSVDWARYIADKAHVPQTSAVGIMSSFQLQHLLNKWIPDIVCEQLRLLVYTSSLMYSLGPQDTYHGYSQAEFRNISSQLGASLVEKLEKLLRRDDLEKASPAKLRAIFMILFGTILAIGYYGLFNRNGSIKEGYQEEKVSHLSKNEQISRSREEWIQILAYRMVEILDRTKILDETVSRDLLVESAQSRWHLPAASTWSVELHSTEESSGKRKPVRRQGPSPPKSLIMKKRMQSYCVTCFAGLLNKTDAGMYLCSHCEKRSIYSIVPLPMPIWNQDQAANRHASPRGLISELRCRKCDIILPNGIMDGLCYGCTCPDIGDFDQEYAGWLYPDYSSHPRDASLFESPAIPNFDIGISANTSSGFFSSIHSISDRISSDSVVSHAKKVSTGEEPLAPKSPLFLDNLGLEGELFVPQNVPTCGHVIGPTQQNESSIGYLV